MNRSEWRAVPIIGADDFCECAFCGIMGCDCPDAADDADFDYRIDGDGTMLSPAHAGAE